MQPSLDTAGLLSTESPLAPLLSVLADNSDAESAPSPLHRWSQWIALTSLVFCVFSLWIYVQWKIAFFGWIVGVTLVTGVSAAAVLVLVGVKATWTEMKNFEREFLSSVSSR